MTDYSVAEMAYRDQLMAEIRDLCEELNIQIEHEE